MTAIDRSDAFQAQYPATYKVYANSNPISSALNSIYDYIHKIWGLKVLLSQTNINNVTQEQFNHGFKKLQELGGTKVSFKTADSVTINGMHFIGKDCSEDSPTLILFNGSGLRFEEYGAQIFQTLRLFKIYHWLKFGVNVLVFNYRGTENDHGSATRDGLIFDGDAAFQYVRDALKVPEDKIILHGHSLGGAIASEVAVLHPSVNYCNDRSFTSLSQQANMMVGGGIYGGMVASLLRSFGWEYNTHANWDKINGHKWILYHPYDTVIPVGSRLIDTIKAVDSKACILEMQPQMIKTKNGPVSENPTLIDNPTSKDINFSGFTAHMRKFRGAEEKAQYEKQIKTAVQG